MTKLELSWTAGFFDGEGSITIAYGNARNSCSLVVCVANTDRAVLEELARAWGGSLHANNPTGNRRQAWHWNIASRQAARFLVDIAPFVHRAVVKLRIELALAFQAQKVRTRDPIALRNYREKQIGYYCQMQRLNDRGNTPRPFALKVLRLVEGPTVPKRQRRPLSDDKAAAAGGA